MQPTVEGVCVCGIIIPPDENAICLASGLNEKYPDGNVEKPLVQKP